MKQTPVQMIPWHQRWGFDVQEFAAGGIRTFAVTEGRDDAVPILFVHGLPGGSFVWAPVISALGRSRRSIAPDLPGWGQSVSRYEAAKPDLSPSGLQQWLNDVLSAQHIERFDLVAQGSGAWPALELLADNPARVRRLALVSPCLWPKPQSFFEKVQKRLIHRDQWTAKRVERWLRQDVRLSSEANETWGLLLRQSIGTGFDEAAYESRFPTYRQALTNYQGAMLLMWGERDPAADPEAITLLSAGLDRPEVQEITGAGHLPMLEKSAETARIFQEFLL
ncbi:MAG: alpha/beta fold hydrolase [Calditrichota bacterium]